MQYAKMIDTIELARHAGESDITGYVNETLYEVFSHWRDGLNLGELTEEEDDALYLAFQEGYGINPTCSCNR